LTNCFRELQDGAVTSEAPQVCAGPDCKRATTTSRKHDRFNEQCNERLQELAATTSMHDQVIHMRLRQDRMKV